MAQPRTHYTLILIVLGSGVEGRQCGGCTSFHRRLAFVLQLLVIQIMPVYARRMIGCSSRLGWNAKPFPPYRNPAVFDYRHHGTSAKRIFVVKHRGWRRDEHVRGYYTWSAFRGD